MDYSKYRNCLRLQITVDDVSSERIDDLVSHCKKFGFDNVMLMLNTEEFNIGHITVEEAKPWIDMFKVAAEKLRENGISVSLNNWIEIGHCDRGRTLKNGQDFTLFTDINGRESTMVACPLCQNWREYHTDLIRYFVCELKPDTYWIEDDFRVHNHAPLSDIGCYCDLHMKLYNERLGTNYTREEFVKKAFAPGKCNPERQAFLDVNRDTMIELADVLSRAAREEYPEIDVALMSSAPFSHALEGRDWTGLFDALSQGGKRINRIHLPYGEASGKDYLWGFNSCSMGIRALSGGDVIVLPETEHGTASTYLKSARFLRFGLESSIPLVTSGMTYSLYDFVGNGVRESLGFGKVIKDIKPYMQGVLDLGLHFSSHSGIVIPIDEKVCYKRTLNSSFRDMEPYEYNLAAAVSAWGMSYKYETKREFKNETVFICSSTVDIMTDDEVKNLFENNFVIVDGGAVSVLASRNLLYLIKARSYEFKNEDQGYHSYEESADDSLRIDGVRRLRGSARLGVGPFAKIEYDGEVTVHTVVKNQYMETLAPAVTSGENFVVWPYSLASKRPKQFCDLRRYHFLKLAAEHTENYAICDVFGISPYLFKEEDKNVVILVNCNLDDYESVPLHLGGVAFEKVYEIGRDGEWIPLDFAKNGNAVEVFTPFEEMSSKTLIFK